jgi:hypothetical protein
MNTLNDFAAASQLVAEFQDKLKVIVARDGARHMMDAHIDVHTMCLLEEELLPLLEQVINSIEYEPTDEEMGGEPPITMAEMHSAAHAQHIAMHS